LALGLRNNANGKGKSNGDRHNWNNKGGGHNNMGGNMNNNTWQNDTISRSVSTATVFGSSVVSSLSTDRTSTSDANFLVAGTNQFEVILRSYPNTICQICHALAHSADAYPNCYHRRQQPVLPTYATISSVIADEQVWYPDSGASFHMTHDDGELLTISPYSGTSLVKVGNGTLLPISHVGHSFFFTLVKPLYLPCVLYVTQLCHNLLSIRQLYSGNNCSVVFYSKSVRFKDNITGDVLLQDPISGSVYPVSLPVEHPLISANMAFNTSRDYWHHHQGHNGAQVLVVLRKNNYLNVSSSFHDDCMTCHLAKSYRLPFDLAEHCTSAPLELIHSNV